MIFAHMRPTVFFIIRASAPHTSTATVCKQGDPRVGRTLNERNPFKIYDAVVCFVDRCLLDSNLAASN